MPSIHVLLKDGFGAYSEKVPFAIFGLKKKGD